MEDCIKFEINLISANNLEDVGNLFGTKVYATVAVVGVKYRTQTDKNSKTNPTWDFKKSFIVSKSEIKRTVSMLTIELYRKRWLKDRYIGKVEVPLKELHKQRAGKTVSFPVKRASSASGESLGKLNFSYSFVDTAAGDGNGIPPWTHTLCKIIYQVATLGFICAS